MSTTLHIDARPRPVRVKNTLKGSTALRAADLDDEVRERRKRTRNRPGAKAPIVETPYFTTEEAASYLKLSPAFLEMARFKADGSGPPFIKLPRAVRYRKSQLDAWMAKHDHPADKPITSAK